MIVRVLFPKSIKSVFILVSCNTSLSKNYVAHSYVTVVCVVEFESENIRRILNLVKTFKVRMSLNSNSSFVTSLLNCYVIVKIYYVHALQNAVA